MLRLPTVILFACLAFVCWGSYGPFLNEGQGLMGSSKWRPFICVGIAYFLVAVLVPGVLIRNGREQGRWTFTGILWSLFAGALGCLGSLGIILAFNAGGQHIYVMPLVFGCAPVVNTLVTLTLSRGTMPGVVFFLGIAMVALGGAGVLYFKPTLPHAGAPRTLASSANNVSSPADPAESERAPAKDSGEQGSEKMQAAPKETTKPWFLGVMGAIVMTALCWGSYGPMLHRGQAAMLGSRLRPFICVGISYFFLAILIPLFVLAASGEPGKWSLMGFVWSLISGALGAGGALAVILAFNSGGSPVFVMPIVFGGAPVMNTVVSTTWSYLKTGQMGDIRTTFLFSLGLVVAGAVTVLLCAPRPKHALPPGPKSEGS